MGAGCENAGAGKKGLVLKTFLCLLVLLPWLPLLSLSLLLCIDLDNVNKGEESVRIRERPCSGGNVKFGGGIADVGMENAT